MASRPRAKITPLPASFDRLLWDEGQGIGYCPVRPAGDLYGADYWHEYQRRADTPIGRALTQARVDFVGRHIGRDALVDVGIGSGQFVEARENTLGADVNPLARAWLEQRNLLVKEQEFAEVSNHLSFWDSLEHIDNPQPMLSACRGVVFVSLPLCDGRAEWLESKHYKPGEHLWYFSWRGLVRWFYSLGFNLVEENTMESDLGREGIFTFAFKRRGE